MVEEGKKQEDIPEGAVKHVYVGLRLMGDKMCKCYVPDDEVREDPENWTNSKMFSKGKKYDHWLGRIVYLENTGDTTYTFHPTNDTIQNEQCLKEFARDQHAQEKVLDNRKLLEKVAKEGMDYGEMTVNELINEARTGRRGREAIIAWLISKV